MFVLYINGQPSDADTNLASAMSKGKHVALREDRVHIESLNASPEIPIPSRAWRFDKEIGDWIETQLPIQFD